MKKAVFSMVFAAVLLSGCGSANQSSKNSSEESTNASSTTMSSVAILDKFENQEEIGEGTLNLTNGSEDTTHNEEVTIVHDPKDVPTLITINTEDIDEDHLSYLYADGQLLTSDELGHTQLNVELQGVPSSVVEGKHVFQLVQYDNDKEDGKIITFKQQPYTVQEKD
jgi:protein involved in sex pheromone biosynthesis